MLRQILLSCVAALSIGAIASAPARDIQMQSLKSQIKISTGNNTLNKKHPSAKTLKQMPASMRTLPTNHHINPIFKPNAQKVARISPSAIYFESFEGDAEHWLPEGWTMESYSEVQDDWSQWYNHGAYPGMLSPIDGNRIMCILYDTTYKDEWLISPEITVPAGQVLSYYWWTQPANLFKQDKEHFDAEEFVFINQEAACTLQVLIKTEGGEWTVVDDLTPKFMGISMSDLVLMNYAEMQESVVDLSDYAGETIQIAFRYVGTDGESLFIDAVGIDLPALTAYYMEPYYKQYYFTSLDEEMLSLPYSIELYPVYEPIVWENYSDEWDGIDFQWTYTDPVTHEPTTADTEDYLAVEYRPDYTDAFTTRNNLYDLPMLTASAEGRSSGSYTAPCNMFQAGGRAEFPILIDENGNDIYFDFGIVPFDYLTEEVGVYFEEPYDFGEDGIPIFGHSNRTDQWWHEYIFDGEDDSDNEAYVTGYMNNVIAPSSPMVVKGGWAYAVGIVSDEAELTMQILATTEDGEIMEEPIAIAKCSGRDIIRSPYGIDFSLMMIPFVFDEPVMLSAEVCPVGYLVEISGFRSDSVEWFAPMQSLKPNPDEWALGYVRNHFVYYGSEFDSLTYVASFENEYGEMYNSFAISLDAYYPWLYSSAKIATMEEDYTVVDFDSYYDGSQLTITDTDGNPLPSWLKASAKGRYNKCKLTLQSTPSAYDREIEIMISAPGVSHVINIDNPSGISSVGTDGSQVIGVYNMAGQKVDENNLSPGVYVVKYKDGTTTKVTK